ncbi:MAG: PQQ-binding-like beta-propeller repeat protein [Proteobacteria bacterium]|nr:PQQ-binding-like beta-propeller repeat protein [Pseudomonadota bacterium]
MTRTLIAAVCLQASLATALCENSTPHFDDVYSEGWGIDLHNTRYQPRSTLNAKNVEGLQLKWAYGLSNNSPRSYPLVTKDTIFIGDSGRGIVALDRENGCERWVFEHDGYISSAILYAKVDAQNFLIFNDRIKGVYAIDGATGKFVWHAEVTAEPLPWYSGTPLIAGNRIYVPVASQEVGLALNPLYGCCTTSGGMAAFDLSTGRKLWYHPTIDEPARQTGSHWFFVQEYGPSGAPVWGAPAYDRETDRLFYGTGQNYTHPTTATSDALFAVHGETGEPIWQRQFTENDAYTAACNWMALNHPNCPKPVGPDADFGAPTMLVHTKAGKRFLIAGQKSAEIHAVNPHTGEVIWTRRIGRGGIIGGVHWGLAASEKLGLVFAPVSDKAILDFPAPGVAAPGLYALDIETGALRWHYTRESRCAEESCEYGLSAAPLATNDVVITGSMDGYLEIYDANDGQRIWHFDAWQSFPTVNDTEAIGGAFDAHGPMVADDLVIVSAGYGYVGAQRSGNAFLVFQLRSSDE